MSRNNWNFIAIFIAVFLLAILFINESKKEFKPVGGDSFECTVTPEEPVSIDTSLNATRKEWFPIPIIQIEKNSTKEGKYAVTLENGLLFYTDKKYEMTDTICWINDAGNLKLCDENKIIDGSNLY